MKETCISIPFFYFCGPKIDGIAILGCPIVQSYVETILGCLAICYHFDVYGFNSKKSG